MWVVWCKCTQTPAKRSKEVRAGDIAALIGMKDVTTGETLCNADKPIILVRMDFPEPVISVAVEPKTKDDQEKMGIALGNLLRKTRLSASKLMKRLVQTIISGMERVAPGHPG